MKMRPLVGTMALAATLTLTAAATAGTVIDPGVYQLRNHPDGAASSPGYGLRLDEVFDATEGHDIFTFDFDHADADMTLTYDGSSINIAGTAFGGLDIGSTYDPLHSGLVTIDFTYDVVGTATGDDDLLVIPQQIPSSGTIELWTGSTVDLFDKASADGYSFRLGDEDGSGHRGFDGISGWGWLGYEPGGYIAATDWLFTVEVPGPSALALLAVGMAFRGRRRI